MPNPNYRDYIGKCRDHVFAAWEGWSAIMTFLVPLALGVASYFGLGLALRGDHHLLQYVGAAFLTLLYFIAVIQFKVWRTEARQVAALQDRLKPQITLAIDEAKNGIAAGKDIEKSDQFYVQVHVKSATDAIISDCIPFITEISHRAQENIGFSTVASEPYETRWSLQPRPTVVLTKGVTHRFNVVSFDDKGGAPRIESLMHSNHVKDHYENVGRTGQHRYRIHVSGRDVMPTEGYITVTWRGNSLPLVDLAMI